MLLMGIAMNEERKCVFDVRCARMYLNIFIFKFSVILFDLYKAISWWFIHDAVMYTILFYFHLLWKP